MTIRFPICFPLFSNALYGTPTTARRFSGNLLRSSGCSGGSVIKFFVDQKMVLYDLQSEPSIHYLFGICLHVLKNYWNFQLN